MIQLWMFIHQEYVFIQCITITLQRSFYVSSSSSFSMCSFNPWQYAMCYKDATKRLASHTQWMHRNIYFSCQKFPSRTGLFECSTPYFQCQFTTRKRNTLLWLTETQQSPFATVTSTKSEFHQNNWINSTAHNTRAYIYTHRFSNFTLPQFYTQNCSFTENMLSVKVTLGVYFFK